MPLFCIITTAFLLKNRLMVAHGRELQEETREGVRTSSEFILTNWEVVEIKSELVFASLPCLTKALLCSLSIPL